MEGHHLIIYGREINSLLDIKMLICVQIWDTKTKITFNLKRKLIIEKNRQEISQLKLRSKNEGKEAKNKK